MEPSADPIHSSASLAQNAKERRKAYQRDYSRRWMAAKRAAQKESQWREVTLRLPLELWEAFDQERRAEARQSIFHEPPPPMADFLLAKLSGSTRSTPKAPKLPTEPEPSEPAMLKPAPTKPPSRSKTESASVSRHAPFSAHPFEKLPSRNAPCPCKSGLKFKRCCGAPKSARA